MKVFIVEMSQGGYFVLHSDQDVSSVENYFSQGWTPVKGFEIEYVPQTGS